MAKKALSDEESTKPLFVCEHGTTHTRADLDAVFRAPDVKLPEGDCWFRALHEGRRIGR